MTRDIDELIAAAVQSGQAPGVVAGYATADTTHVTTAGRATIDGPEMQRNTIFRISSMTKPITAAAILALADSGVVDINDPIDDLLPELSNRQVLRDPAGELTNTEPAQRPITIKDLLTFTWGFGMQGAMFMAEKPWPIVQAAAERDLHVFGPAQPDLMPDPDTWLARLGELPLLAQPGDRWLYQTGSQVLGVLAARVTGRPFPEVLRTHIFEPLNMQDTAFHTTETTRLATAYQTKNGQFEITDPPDGQWSTPPRFPDGGGGLLSTVDDMLKFGRMLLDHGGPVLRPETVAEMTRDQLTTEQRDRVWPGFSFLDDRGWGYGVSVLGDGSYTWEGGFGTNWYNAPAADLTVVVLTQRTADETGLPAICHDVPTALQN